MKFSWIAALALFGTAMAIPQAETTPGPSAKASGAAAAAADLLPAGAPCTKDGSMGICESGVCIQDVNANQGTCQ
ncbi:hypothetical protein BJX61DRAFT_546834 [Aspergillus egyptiacus]|nr:hypothetical protein BJX61DRAFT_546834 [Aspergillus egyptiacus]